MAADDPVLRCPTATAWEQWLDEHHEQSDGVWLELVKAPAKAKTKPKTTRKGTATSEGPAEAGADEGAEPPLNYALALDVALCHGWIDGHKVGVDDRVWRQRFTPRRPRSKWSKINCAKAEALITAGRMRPAGQHQVDLAKADGRWEAAYESQRTATVPPDLQAALDAEPDAAAAFATLNSANRYAILYRVQDAKRPETRARRIETFVAMLLRGETLH